MQQEQLESHYAKVLCLEREQQECASGSSPAHSNSLNSERREKEKHQRDRERNAAREAFIKYELQRYNSYATLLSSAIRQGERLLTHG